MFNFFKNLMPREENFFVLFRQMSALLVDCSHQFSELVKNLNRADGYAKQIQTIEQQADDVTHKTMDLLHKTFITPMDREDIHQLIKTMDDVLDFYEAASERIALFKITRATPYLISLSEICAQSVDNIQKITAELHELKNPEGIIRVCVEINRLENEADYVLRKALADLFENESDTKSIIKYKEIYELLETVTDRCEDVANIVEGIVLEYV